MTPTRAAVCLVAVALAASHSVPAMLAVVKEVAFPSGGIVEPWFYTSAFWQASVTLLACDAVRQVLHRKVFRVRLTLELILTVVAWINERQFFLPSYEIVVIFAGYVFAYGAAFWREFRAIQGCASTPPTDARRTYPVKSLCWTAAASVALAIGHYGVFAYALPLARWQVGQGALRLERQVQSKGFDTDLNAFDQQLNSALGVLDQYSIYNAALFGVAIACISMAIITAWRERGPTDARSR